MTEIAEKRKTSHIVTSTSADEIVAARLWEYEWTF